LPFAVRKVLLLLPAERLAVGTPLRTFSNANLAEAVALLPRSKSGLEVLSKIAPFCWSNGEPPLATGRRPVTSVALVKLTSEDERTPLVSEWTIPVPPIPEKMMVPDDVSPVKPVRVPAAIRFGPEAVSAAVPAEMICTLPVDALPSCNV